MKMSWNEKYTPYTHMHTHMHAHTYIIKTQSTNALPRLTVCLSQEYSLVFYIYPHLTKLNHLVVSEQGDKFEGPYHKEPEP